MESMNISLPEPMKAFVDGQIAQGRYSSVSEYVRELIRADEKRKAEEQLEAKLLEGLSGAESELTVRSNSSKSNGLKSRPGSCPYAPVA